MSELAPGSAGEAPGYGGIHGDIVALLEAARHAAARSVNALMTASYGTSAGASLNSSRAGGIEPSMAMT